MPDFPAVEEVRRTFQTALADPQQYSPEELRIKFLGRKGLVNELFKKIKELPAEERGAYGAACNRLKNEIQQALEKLLPTAEASLPAEEDPTLPGLEQALGHLHPLEQTLREIVRIFHRLGFTVAEGPEVETEWRNFDALNFPPEHPARDMQDTFFLKNGQVLRTHTSPVQIRVMQAYEPPIRTIMPGRVYRNEAINPRSYCLFHQVEGLYVDRNVTFAELKGTLDLFCKELYGANVKLRFRPSFFPFTEPSSEVDITCFLCGGKGCRVCKHTGWLEILGCGMVDPAVFSNVGLDPEKWTGYAFGMGIERIAMLKYGIDDIRLFFENDLRFLEQF